MRLWHYILMICMLLATLQGAVAEERIEGNLDTYKAGDGDIYQSEQTGFWDQLQQALFSERVSGDKTVVGDAVCSREPDKNKDFTWVYCNSGETQLYTITNDQYEGMVWQIFEVQPEWNYITEYKIPKGSTAYHRVECNKEYHFSIYYCDETAERSCTDSDGDDKTQQGKVTFTVDGSTEEYVDECDDSNTLLERVCDSDNSVQTKIYECDCEGGQCVTDDGQCDFQAVGDKYCKNGDVVQKFQYSDCSEEVVTSESCSDTENCENGECVQSVQMVNCYQCQDGDVVSKEFEDVCGTDWQRSRPECTTTVTCYQCQDGEAVSQDFTDTCGDGWSQTKPECINKTLCYQCQNGEVVSQVFDNGCDEGWSTNQPDSCDGTGQEPGQPQPTLFERIVSWFTQIFGGGV